MYSLSKALIPAPKEIKEGTKTFRVAEFNGVLPEVHCDTADDVVEEGIGHIYKRLSELTGTMADRCVSDEGNGYLIDIIIDPDAPAFAKAPAESYYVETTQEKAILCGKDAAGALYASITFAQMVYEQDEEILVPEAYIFDFPDFQWRGISMECRYGTEFLTKQHWMDMIDYYVSMKFNDLQITVYNCWSHQYDGVKTQCLYVPIKKYPQLKTPKNIKYYSVAEKKWIHKENLLPPMFEEDFFGELIQYGKKKNVHIRPHFNSLGHNTLIPQYFPEISAVGEDGKPTLKGFCTRNEKTYEMIFGIYDELIDRYLLPNGVDEFCIGLDEVTGDYICHCDKCKGVSHKELMMEYIIKLCKYLKNRGMKTIIMDFDMLFYNFNIVNEELKELFIKEGIYDEVMLDWWAYQDPVDLFHKRADEVNHVFRSLIKPATGYYHWAIPTENNENIRACAKLGKKLGFEAIEAYSSFEYCYDKNYLTLADVGWNADKSDEIDEFDERYAYRYYPDNIPAAVEAFRAMSDIMKDETRAAYLNRAVWRLESYFYCYRKWDAPEKLRNFPGEAYKLVSDKEEEYLPYLRYLKEKSSIALNFFENSGVSSQMNDTWLLSAKHYYTLADEYLTLYGLHKSYNQGLSDEYKVMAELERLIIQREELMLLGEKTRIDVNRYTYLRGMSWFRQFMLDLLAYFKKEVAQGRKPKLDMTDLSYATGKMLEFLQ